MINGVKDWNWSLIDEWGIFMNNHHTPLKNIQHRKILDMMGVSLWIDKQAKKHPLPNGLENSRLRHLLVDKTPKNTKVIAPKNDDITKSNIQKSSDEFVAGVDIKNLIVKNNTNNQDDKNIVHENVLPDIINMSKVRFYLQGLRYGQWVFVVNVLTMSEQEQALWQSLKNALMQEVQKNDDSNNEFLYREIHYPLVDDEFYADMVLNPAQYTFDGFVIGLSALNGYTAKMVFLNDMPNEIAIPPSQKLPTINDMITNPHLKKDFWQKVVG